MGTCLLQGSRNVDHATKDELARLSTHFPVKKNRQSLHKELLRPAKAYLSSSGRAPLTELPTQERLDPSRPTGP